MSELSAFLPGSLRPRAAHALADPTGACPLIYDLERGRLVEVPDEFQYHIRDVLETLELNEELVGWLADVDLLTFERWDEPAAAPGWGAQRRAALGGVFLAGGAVHCRPGTATPTGEVVAFPFERVAALPVVFHLTFRPGRARDLEWLVRTAVGHAAEASRTVRFELSGAATRLDDATAALVAAHRFRVRLVCPPALPDGRLRGRSGGPLGARVERLAAALGPRLTVHARLGRGDRLADLWRWARQAGVQRLEAVKSDGRPGVEHGPRVSETQAFRADLATVCDDMFEALSAGQPQPLLYEPVARVVRTMMAGGSGSQTAAGGFLVLVRDGRLIPGPLPDARLAAPAAPAAEGRPGGEPCASCWARFLCAHSRLVPNAGTVLPEEPRLDRCELWRDEVKTALFFYHRLQQADPDGLLGFPLEGPRTPFAGRPEEGRLHAGQRTSWIC